MYSCYLRVTRACGRISCTWTRACLYSALVRYSRVISFACKFAKTRVHGYAHAIRAILNTGTVLASIKFKSSCTVVCERINRDMHVRNTYKQSRNSYTTMNNSPILLQYKNLSLLYSLSAALFDILLSLTRKYSK